MDNSRVGLSALRSGSVSHYEQPYASKQLNTCSTGDAVQDLGNVLYEALQVIDENSKSVSDSPTDEDGSSSLEDENIVGDPQLNLNDLISCKSLHKCATFPATVSSEGKVPVSQPENKACTRSLSMPTRKIVSALKGSRDKEGDPPKKLSVSWAPDVYDPPPSSVSHYPKKKTQQQSKSKKKYGKGKQKGKNARSGGNGPKEKKHYRKMGGRSDRCLNSYADTDRVYNYEACHSLLDFDDVGDSIGRPDPNCGSNFLGQSSGTMHCVC